MILEKRIGVSSNSIDGSSNFKETNKLSNNSDNKSSSNLTTRASGSQAQPMRAPIVKIADPKKYLGSTIKNIVFDLSTTTNSLPNHKSNFDCAASQVTLNNIFPDLLNNSNQVEAEAIKTTQRLLTTYCNNKKTPLYDAMFSYLISTREDFDNYPDHDKEPALTAVAEVMWDKELVDTYKPLLILGNGASELIDLTSRVAMEDIREQGSDVARWSPWLKTQYRGHEGSALTSGFIQQEAGLRSSNLISIVNPSNPGGEYQSADSLLEDIKSLPSGTFVVIDESGNCWNPKYEEETLSKRVSDITKISKENNVHIFVISSWTKIFACLGGARLGTCIAPSQEFSDRIKSMQVHWSMSNPSLAFFSKAIKDQKFLDQTRQSSKAWNAYIKEELKKIIPQSEIESDNNHNGEGFVPYLWIDLKKPDLVTEIYHQCRQKGVPVHPGGPVYSMPSFIRVKTVPPNIADIFLDAVRNAKFKMKYD